jgi:uncharacterized protein YneF (UPF0154 family)
MISASGAVAVSLGLFLAMLMCLEIGFQIGRRRMGETGEQPDEGSGVIEAAIFGLLGLLLAFSFAGGEGRLDARRQLIVHEANAISTAYLRLDLLPDSEQPRMRHLFREYLDTRLEVHENLSDDEARARVVTRASQIQHEIWVQAVVASRLDASQNIGRLLLPALNEMIDVTTSREIALQTHMPPLIFVLLICIALLSGVLAGYAMTKGRRRSWVHGLIFAAVISVTIYAVLDLDSPRSGLIRLDAADSALQELRSSIQ